MYVCTYVYILIIIMIIIIRSKKFCHWLSKKHEHPPDSRLGTSADERSAPTGKRPGFRVQGLV